MHRLALFLLPLVYAATGLAQTAPADSPALEALVSEIRQLRQEMQATTVAAQRVQIALFRMQAQTTAAARAASRLDELRSRVSGNQNHRNELASNIQRIEEKQRTSQDPNEQKELAAVLPQVKVELDGTSLLLQQLQAQEAEAELQFRTEQAKLNDLQDLLDKLDKILDGYSKK